MYALTLQNRSTSIPSPAKLAALLEQAESPANASANEFDATVASPVAPPNTAIASRASAITYSPLKTPNTSSRFHLPLEEMHPSKAHSAIKKSASRLQLQGAESLLRAPKIFSSSTVKGGTTPTSSKGSLPSHLSSPKFEFSFPRPDIHLSVETQRIMDSVREEAAKIKAEMQLDRDNKNRKNEEAEQVDSRGGRKIAKARGKAGRFSEIHMQEFRKMDSIANHASLSRFQQPTASSLKRSNSKAHLDSEETEGRALAERFSDDEAVLQNNSPVKRARKNIHDDKAAARPMSPNPSKHIPSAFITPTKASLARSASAKQIKTMIPSLFRTPSSKAIPSPTHPKTEGSQKFLPMLSGFKSMKSFLYRQPPTLPNERKEAAVGTGIPLFQEINTQDKDIGTRLGPRKAHDNTNEGVQPSTPLHKRVEFSASTNARYDLEKSSPSPSKTPGLQMHRAASPFPGSEPVAYPSLASNSPRPAVPVAFLPPSKIADSQSHHLLGAGSKSSDIYPSLAESPNITTRARTPSRPSNVDNFTFRTEKAWPGKPGTNESSPRKTPLSTPGSRTIRQVRPSGIVTPVEPFDFPAIPHGLRNKKRYRADSDDENENIPPENSVDGQGEQGPRTKKVKISSHKDLPSPNKKTARGRAIASSNSAAGNAQAAKRVLSLSRLNALARPKTRG